MSYSIKLTSIMKATGFLAFMLLMFPLTGCGSSPDEPDEPIIPDVPDIVNPPNTIPDETYDPNEFGYLSPSILPGDWIFETFTPENGATEKINLPFTILPFTVKQDTDNVVIASGREVWAVIYENFTQISTAEGLVDNPANITYIKNQKAPLSEALIMTLNLVIVDPSSAESFFLSMIDFSFKDDIVTIDQAFYGHYLIGGSTDSREGTVTLRKVK